MSNLITENEIEQITLEVLRDDLEYNVLFGPDIVESDTPERTHAEVVFETNQRD